MATTKRDPNTIWLGGHRVEIGDIAASEAITPGHLILRFNNNGVIRFKKHDSAEANAVRIVATEQSMLNKGVDDAYAANDLVEASELAPGSSAWMFINSGQTIVAGQLLESAGDGTLRALAAGVALFSSLENVTATVSPTRLRVEVV